MAGELRENPKEVAEHVMLVDLARNDVGRIARFGTMHVDELLTLERYSHVMHLTSQVSGDLVEGEARSTCSAPRCRREPSAARRRCGPWRSSTTSSPSSVGRTPASSATSTSPATWTPPSRIRTMFVGPHGVPLQAGAGIVADSIPDDEDLECRNKAAALLAKVPAARRMTPGRAEDGTPA